MINGANGSNLNKVFYDTPQFGNEIQSKYSCYYKNILGSFEFNQKIQTPLGFGIHNNYEEHQKTATFQMNLNMNLQKNTFSVPEEQTQEIVQDQLSSQNQSDIE